MAKNMFLLILRKATIMWRPIIRLMRESVGGGVDYYPFLAYFYGQCFTLVIEHQPLQWLMESDKQTSKLAMWALLLQEYEVEIVDHVGITSLDKNGLSRNPSPSDGDLTKAMRHDNCDWTAVPGWHAISYLTLFLGAPIEVFIQSSCRNPS